QRPPTWTLPVFRLDDPIHEIRRLPCSVGGSEFDTDCLSWLTGFLSNIYCAVNRPCLVNCCRGVSFHDCHASDIIRLHVLTIISAIALPQMSSTISPPGPLIHW